MVQSFAFRKAGCYIHFTFLHNSVLSHSTLLFLLAGLGGRELCIGEGIMIFQ